MAHNTLTQTAYDYTIKVVMYKIKNARSQQKPQQQNSRRRKPLFVVGLFVGGGLIFAILELTHVTHFFIEDSSVVASTGSQSTKGEPVQSNSNAGTTDSPEDTKTSSDKTAGSAAGSTVDLQPPNGNFVSAHRVNLSSQLTSVCNSSSGASCVITFKSSDGVSKSLTKATVDQGGSAYWNNWTPKSIGLTAGTWQIAATATLGDQSKSASDAMEMVVSE